MGPTVYPTWHIADLVGSLPSTVNGVAGRLVANMAYIDSPHLYPARPGPHHC